MKTVIVYDSSDRQAQKVHEALMPLYSAAPAVLESIDIAQHRLKSCIGCFGCWIRTPGICVHTTDFGRDFLSKLFDADTLMFITEITWGGYSPGIKSYADRLLPLLHPYFVKRNGEMHHKLRYQKMPTQYAVGFGAGSAAEERTFVRYAEAHRDNLGGRAGTGTFIWKTGNGAKETDQAAACAEWFLKETAQ
jgi:multimeric flavodoxin WrbA